MVYDHILKASAIKRVEEYCFINLSVESKILMKNAAEALCSVISDNISDKDRVCFVCGRGNNGGDGYACALMMKKTGYDVFVVCNGFPSSPDSLFYYDEYINNGGVVLDCSEDESAFDKIISSSVVVDCLYGIGFHGAMNSRDSAIIDVINSCGALVFSCDVPSGTYADTAEVGFAVCADFTVSCSAYKASNISYPSKEYNGEVILKDIGIPKEAFNIISNDDIIFLPKNDNIVLPKRVPNSHKGTYGSVAMYCGSDNMIGACVFSSTAALRMGVGLVKVCSEETAIKKLQQRLSEPVFSVATQEPVDADSYVVGCGIGKSLDDIIEHLLLRIKKPIVIDADGINFISTHIDVLKNMTAPVVLTPHPVEMARLIGESVNYVNEHRIEIARHFAIENNCVVVLKGNRTVIASPEFIAINTSGTDSLSKGGSGDVLSGMIGACLAMGLSPFDSALTSCYVHGILGEVSSPSELMSEMVEKIKTIIS